MKVLSKQLSRQDKTFITLKLLTISWHAARENLTQATYEMTPGLKTFHRLFSLACSQLLKRWSWGAKLIQQRIIICKKQREKKWENMCNNVKRKKITRGGFRNFYQGGPNFGSERTVELFCGKLLLTETTTWFSIWERRPVAVGAGNTALRAEANRSQEGICREL